MDNKKNTLFKINNILLSAYKDDDDELRELLTLENDTLSNDGEIKVDYLEEYKNIKSSNTITASQENEASFAGAIAYMTQNNPAQAFGILVQLYKKEPDNIDIIKNICKCLLMLKGYKTIIDVFGEKLKTNIDNDTEVMNIYASALFSSQENYSEAIPLFEELVKAYPKDSDMWFRLGFSIERTYQDKYLAKQIECAKKAVELSDGNTSNLAFLARLLYRNGDTDGCQKCFDEMFKHNPKAEDIVIYGRFLMKEGRLTEGYDIYRQRFETGIVAYPKLLLPEKRWDGHADLSNSTVILHYEQGFGDSVMFSRYIPELSKMAKKLIFVVQKNLIPIFKTSGYDKYCKILSHEADINPNIELENTNRSVMYSKGQGMGMIEHDYHIPIMDLPYLMKESPDKMFHSGGYLKTDKKKVSEFRKKYINKNNKLKIGLSYHGTKESILTYRDISVKEFLPLFGLEGVEFYSFQSDKYADELKELDSSIEITDLGKVFKNFEDTACAMECMDLIISTDNVVMNLGGALGIKTFGIFNKYTESRWYKLDGNNIGWYKSVRPFHAKTFNDWTNVITDIKSVIENEFL